MKKIFFSLFIGSIIIGAVACKGTTNTDVGNLSAAQVNKLIQSKIDSVSTAMADNHRAEMDSVMKAHQAESRKYRIEIDALKGNRKGTASSKGSSSGKTTTTTPPKPDKTSTSNRPGATKRGGN